MHFSEYLMEFMSPNSEVCDYLYAPIPFGDSSLYQNIIEPPEPRIRPSRTYWVSLIEGARNPGNRSFQVYISQCTEPGIHEVIQYMSWSLLESPHFQEVSVRTSLLTYA